MEVMGSRILTPTTRATHLYRHLLREVGYLPDRIARRELRNQIVKRFRKNVGKRNDMLRGSQTHFELLQRDLHSAEKGLRKLRKANDGSIPSLLSCLKEAYHRSGRGRHKSLGDLLSADHDVDGEDQRQAKPINKPVNISYTDKKTVEHRMFEPPEILPGNRLRYSVSQQYSKLYALITSPRHQKALDLRRAIRHNLVIEDASMARSRVKNKLKKWYAAFLAKVPVPLPESEWTELRDLALGNKPWDGPPRRRTRVGRRPFHLSKVELERFIHLEELDPSLPLANEVVSDGVKSSRPLPIFRSHHASVPLFSLEGTWLESRELRQEVTQDILEEELQIADRFVVKGWQKSNPHIITARFMRRLWAQVFRGIPLLQKTADGKWSVTWGHDELLKVETPKDLTGLFESLEGVDSSKARDKRCEKSEP
jgi:hypothetical protein